MRRPFILFFLSIGFAHATPIRALVIDGRSNHDWEVTTDALRAILESTERFEVSVSTAPELPIPGAPKAPKDESPAFAEYSAAYKELTKPIEDAFGATWESWSPDFAVHDVVILDSPRMQAELETR